jgi:amino acid adenylation domain-containing protein
MTLEAAFAIVLARYSGQLQVPIGTSVANRRRVQTEPLIGLFVNMVVLANDLSGDPTVRELLGRTREVVLDAFAHQDLPFEKIAEDLDSGTNARYSRLLQATFAIQNTPKRILQLPELEVSVLPVERQQVQFDMILAIEPGAALSGFFQYRADRFEGEMVEGMLRHFRRALEFMATDPDRRISAIDLLSEAELHQLLFEWNDTAPYTLSTLIEVIEAQAVRTPDLAAAVCGGESLSYRELNERANKLAHYLRSLGVRPEVKVGICLGRSLDLLVAFLATLKSGGAYVPLDPGYPRQRLQYMLQDSGAQVLLTCGSHRDALQLDAETTVCIDRQHGLIRGQPPTNPPVIVEPSNLAYIIYTSGSTGIPKGVQVEHRSVRNLAMGRRGVLDVNPGDRVLQFFSFSFDAFVWEVVMAWSAGATLCLRPSEQLLPGAELLATLAQERITHVTMPPSALAVLPEAELPSLRVLIVGAEACGPELVKRWGTGRRFINAYGPTETTVCATLAVCDDDGTTPIGRTLENISAYVLDRNYALVPPWVSGELYLGGAAVTRGYLGQPELTAARFIPDPFGGASQRLFATGDMVRWRSDGQLEFLGRQDQQVKVRGHRVEPGEVEAALLRCQGVREAAVVVQHDGPDARLVAYFVPNTHKGVPNGATDPIMQEPATSARQVREALRQLLPYYMVPSEFRSIAAIPRQPTGKLDRAALHGMEVMREAGHHQTGMARSTVEFQLELIWAEILQVQPGRDDNFFDLGGHSLLAVRLIRQIDEVFGQRLPLAALFQHATIAQMAELLTGPAPKEATSPIVRIQPFGSRPPIFGIHAAGGHVISYVPLARRLGFDQPFYGIQSFASEQAPADSVEEMAATYIGHMRSLQPHGPYSLIGMSFGGAVAFEMARQLMEQGQKIKVVGMIDTVAPPLVRQLHAAQQNGNVIDSAVRIAVLSRQEARRFGLNVTVTAEELRGLSREEQIRNVLDRFGALGDFPDVSVGVRNLELFERNERLFMEFHPRTYAGKLSLFRARDPNEGDQEEFGAEAEQIAEIRDSNPTLGWSEICTQPVDVHLIPGDHVTVSVEPNVSVIAEALQSYLAPRQRPACS